MDPQNLKDLAGRIQRGGRGAKTSIGFALVAGAVGYGLYQSMYTGKFVPVRDKFVLARVYSVLHQFCC